MCSCWQPAADLDLDLVHALVLCCDIRHRLHRSDRHSRRDFPVSPPSTKLSVRSPHSRLHYPHITTTLHLLLGVGPLHFPLRTRPAFSPSAMAFALSPIPVRLGAIRVSLQPSSFSSFLCSSSSPSLPSIPSSTPRHPRASLASPQQQQQPAEDPCPSCGGRKTLPCTLCNAFGFLKVDEATVWRTCHICRGHAKIVCPQCAPPPEETDQNDPALPATNPDSANNNPQRPLPTL